MAGRLPSLAFLLLLLGACNMAISETPLFAERDAAALKPRPGIWLSEDPDCRFDSALPEAQWPECAIWLIASSSAGEIVMNDGKGQAQSAHYIITKGQPPIVQILWRGEAKEDGKAFYVFFGLEPGPAEPDGMFAAASTWEVKCGVKHGSDIEPYTGISPECRPSSQESIRSAARASRATAEMAMRWRWLRAVGS